MVAQLSKVQYKYDETHNLIGVYARHGGLNSDSKKLGITARYIYIYIYIYTGANPGLNLRVG